jgi:hypothetical protein
VVAQKAHGWRSANRGYPPNTTSAADLNRPRSALPCLPNISPEVSRRFVFYRLGRHPVKSMRGTQERDECWLFIMSGGFEGG